MVYKWRDNHTPIFLKFYKNHECLWNNKYEDYKNKNCRENAIKSLCSDLNLPGLTEYDVKAKIKTIRTRYIAELTKIKKAEKCGTEKYVPKLFWFNQADLFLRKVSVPRSGNLNLNYSNNSPVEDLMFLKTDDSNEEIDTQIFNEATDSISRNLYPEMEITEINNSNDLRDGKTCTNGTKVSFGKQTKKRIYTDQIVAIDHTINKLSNNENRDKEDEFDFFCKSLAIQLKNMPIERALICQEKLQSVMTQERLSQIVQSH